MLKFLWLQGLKVEYRTLLSALGWNFDLRPYNQGVLVSDQDPLKLLPLPWRSNNIKYASNEIYLDVIESIDCTMDTEGRVLSSAIHGMGSHWSSIRLPLVHCPAQPDPVLSLKLFADPMYPTKNAHVERISGRVEALSRF